MYHMCRCAQWATLHTNEVGKGAVVMSQGGKEKVSSGRQEAASDCKQIPLNVNFMFLMVYSIFNH